MQQATDNRHQTTGNKQQQITGDRQQTTGNRTPATGKRKVLFFSFSLWVNVDYEKHTDTYFAPGPPTEEVTAQAVTS